MTDLSGQAILVTGASTGIGAASAVARAVVWLAGETDGFITGETIYIAGGA